MQLSYWEKMKRGLFLKRYSKCCNVRVSMKLRDIECEVGLMTLLLNGNAGRAIMTGLPIDG